MPIYPMKCMDFMGYKGLSYTWNLFKNFRRENEEDLDSVYPSLSTFPLEWLAGIKASTPCGLIYGRWTHVDLGRVLFEFCSMHNRTKGAPSSLFQGASCSRVVMQTNMFYRSLEQLWKYPFLPPSLPLLPTLKLHSLENILFLLPGKLCLVFSAC